MFFERKIRNSFLFISCLPLPIFRTNGQSGSLAIFLSLPMPILLNAAVSSNVRQAFSHTGISGFSLFAIAITYLSKNRLADLATNPLVTDVTYKALYPVPICLLDIARIDILGIMKTLAVTFPDLDVIDIFLF